MIEEILEILIGAIRRLGGNVADLEPIDGAKKYEMIKKTEKILLLKKQIVLQGPPGTGKTRLAKLIAEELIQPSEVGNPISIIDSFLNNFNPDGETVKAERAARQKLLSDFQTRFPIESLKNMTLDDFCAGKGDRNNFCWWIETGLKSLGKYAPGSARSYLIYWSKDDDEYKKHGRLVKDIVNDEEAMQKIAELLYKVVKSKNPADALEYFGDSFILKVLNSYYPDEFFPINGRDSLDNALKLFGVSGGQLSKFEKNKILNEQFQQRKDQLYSKADAFEFMRFLFSNFNLKTGEDLDTNQSVVSKGEYQLVQFHPSYSYEDFVRGIVASAADKGIVYKTENRILADFASKAIDNPNANYVLIIDEMNRANLPAVLGELIYALEYRGEKVTSMYEYEKEREITLPPNLYIIGTMNTADRSVGHIDYAIRRRFAFVPVTPSDRVIDEVITDSAVRVQAKSLYQKVAAFFSPALLMGDFKQDEVQLGHSYFLAQTTDQLELKLEYEIKPLLREYLKDGILKSVRNDNDEDQTEIDINSLKVE